MTPASPAPAPAPRALVAASLIALYLVWGSTYFAMRVALESFSPFTMAGLRFCLAGTLMLGWLKLRGAAWPTARQWLNSAMLGVLLLGIGNGFVAQAETEVASGLAAVMVASSPLWAALFSGVFGRWPEKREWVGLAIGALGVVALNFGGELSASPRGAVLLLIAPCAWAFGSMWGKTLDLPKGSMLSACEMICAGPLMLGFSLLRGAPVHTEVTVRAGLAVIYLALFGSIVAFSAYLFLLRTVRPSLALSYAYVNPVVAVILGVTLGSEKVSASSLVGMGVVLVGVVIVAARRSPAPAQPVPAPALSPGTAPTLRGP